MHSLRPLSALHVIYALTAACLVITGVGFIVDPGQFYALAAYRVILRMADIGWWGWVFVLVGVAKMVMWRRSERCLRIGSAVGGAVASGLAGGFISAAVTGGPVVWSAIMAWTTIALVQLVGAAATWRT